MHPTPGVSVCPGGFFLAGAISSSTRPTLGPRGRSTTLPRASGSLLALLPTQRCAIEAFPDEVSTREEAHDLVAVMRLNVQLLGGLVEASGSPLARDALTDIHRALDRLDNRLGFWSHPSSEGHE